MTKIIRHISLAAILLLIFACQKQKDGVQGEAVLMISINGIDTGTKALPSQLVKPDAADFTFNVVETATGHSIFTGKAAADNRGIKVKPDVEYEVYASYGRNAGAELDAPYYTGTSETVSVGLNEVKNVQISCCLGNALISAEYGSTVEEQQRFQQMFSNYGLLVSCDGMEVFMSGSKNAYIKAGSAYTVVLKATSRQDNSEKTFTVPNLPEKLNSRENLKITFSFGQGADIIVEKAEITEATAELSIPYAWLPAPRISAQHVFDQDGTLLGTSLETSTSFPGCTWTASVINSDGITVRTMSGSGALYSDCTDGNWPYLPSGDYTARYTYVYNSKEIAFDKTYRFSVPSPESLAYTLEGAYTSYSLYSRGDIIGANACDKGTIYGPTAKVAIAENILKNSNYSNLPVTFIAKVDDTQLGSTNSSNTNIQIMDNAANLASRTAAYVYSVEARFDGWSSTKSESLHITGLPVTYNPPSSTSGWSWINRRDGEWKNDHVKLATGATPASEARTPDYHLPDDVNVKVTSDLDQYGTFLGIKCGYEVKFVNKNTSKRYTTDNPRAFYYHDGTLSGADYITIKNTYVAAGYYLRVYNVKIEYR